MFNKDDMIKSEYEIKEVIVFIKDLQVFLDFKKLEIFKIYLLDIVFLDKLGIWKRFILGDKRYIFVDEI